MNYLPNINFASLFLVPSALLVFGGCSGANEDKAQEQQEADAQEGDGRHEAALNAPVTAQAVGANQVNVYWRANKETDLAGYKVFRDGKLIVYRRGTQNSYSDGTVVGGTKYMYQVSAFDIAGNESGKSAPVYVTTPPAAYEGFFFSDKVGKYPFIRYYSSYSRNITNPERGLAWHVGEGSCFHPTLPLLQTPIEWGIAQDDYRGRSTFLLATEQWLGATTFESHPEIRYAGRMFRITNGFRHRAGACRNSNDSFTLHLTCNGWTQSSVVVPCSQVYDGEF